MGPIGWLGMVDGLPILFEHHVCVCSRKTKGIHANNNRIDLAGEVQLFRQYANGQSFPRNTWVGIAKMKARRKLSILECKRCFDKARHTGCGLAMPDISF